MPVDPADPFATPASTQEEHDARVALVAELRAAQQQAGQAEMARANIQRWIQRLEASGSGRGALADDMRQFLTAYDKVTGESQ